MQHLGYEINELVDMLNNDDAVKAQRLRKLYAGEQESETIKYLDSYAGIRDWRNAGYSPKYRNLVEQIISKSGLIFNDGLPTFTLSKDGVIDDENTSLLLRYINYYDFQSKIKSLDVMTRLLKSSILLIGWDVEDDKFSYEICHHGNSYVIVDAKRNPTLFIHRTGDNTFQVITIDGYYSYREHTGGYELINQQPNTFGIIPIVPFHDRFEPIYGYLHKVSDELSAFNLSINKKLTELDYSVSWSQSSTLFTNIRMDSLEGKKIGPGSVVAFEMDTVDQQIYAEYKNPSIDVDGVFNYINQSVYQMAAQYQVRVEADSSNITSGFQLVVKESGNLDLKRERQRPFEKSFVEMFEVMNKIILVVKGFDFSDLVLNTTFPTPALPINELEQEQIWTIKINEGRATIRDYLIEYKRMTPEEADKKLIELKGQSSS